MVFSASARHGRKELLIRASFGIVCLLAVATVAGGAAAETLVEAMAAAYRDNPTLLGQRAALRATDERVPEALSGWRPTVTVTGEIGKADVETETAFFSSEEKRTPETYVLKLSQPLFRGGRTFAETRRAKNLVLADRARLAEVEQDVLLQATTAYMNVLREEAVLDLAVRNEQRLRRQLEAARDRFEVGEVTRTDVAQAESRVSTAVADRIRDEGNLVNSRASYLNVIGVIPEMLSTPPALAGLPASEAESRDIAVRENPKILRAMHTEQAARDDIALVFGELLPSLNLDGELSRAEDTASRGSVTERAQITARLSMPLYQAGAVTARLRAAKETASQRRQEIERDRRSVLENVTQKWKDLQTARAQIAAFGDAVRAAEIALDGVTQEAAVGSRTTLDVLDAEQELFDAKVNLVRAERDEVVASFALQGAIGRLTAARLGLPVQIYDERRHYDAVRNKFWGVGGDD